jgi:3-deoxy-manno-octulosonate cytidylyltransferase (CMP-KDO synthetase)
MSVAVILPARLESTRLPRKLLLRQTGKTVLAHTVEKALAAQAASAGRIVSVTVACDAPELAAEATRAGAQAVMTSPLCASGSDRAAEAAAQIDAAMIVNVQADEPEIEPEYILTVARLLADDPTAAMATLAAPIFDEEKWRKPGVVKVARDRHKRALLFSRAPIPFIREPEEERRSPAWTDSTTGRRIFGLQHLGLYAYRRDFLLSYAALPPSTLEKLEKLEQLRALEAGRVILVEVVPEHPPGIDTPEDYAAFVRRYRG